VSLVWWLNRVSFQQCLGLESNVADSMGCSIVVAVLMGPSRWFPSSVYFREDGKNEKEPSCRIETLFLVFE
jgi:hypothetical protein